MSPDKKIQLLIWENLLKFRYSFYKKLLSGAMTMIFLLHWEIQELECSALCNM